MVFYFAYCWLHIGRRGGELVLSIDLQATPSCLDADTYIFDEVQLQCSVTSLLEYSSILGLHAYALIKHGLYECMNKAWTI